MYTGILYTWYILLYLVLIFTLRTILLLHSLFMLRMGGEMNIRKIKEPQSGAKSVRSFYLPRKCTPFTYRTDHWSTSHHLGLLGGADRYCCTSYRFIIPDLYDLFTPEQFIIMLSGWEPCTLPCLVQKHVKPVNPGLDLLYPVRSCTLNYNGSLRSIVF